jgi:hypothetical protein
MQIVPLCDVLTVAIEDLYAVALSIGNIYQSVFIARDVMRNIEISWLNAWPAPRKKVAARRRIFMYRSIAVPIADVDVALRGQRTVGASVERFSRHVFGFHAR